MVRLRRPIAHFQQRADGDCLAACAAMVAGYSGVAISYRRLLRTLNARPDIGTPFSNIKRLEQLQLTVHYGRGTIEDLRRHLERDRPIVAFVDTGQLPYWQYATSHAVVLAGLDDSLAIIHDPDLSTGPVAVSADDFLLAWLEGDELFAAVSS